MKQTAVEWLAEQLIESHYSDVIDKAKEMEKEQMNHIVDTNKMVSDKVLFKQATVAMKEHYGYGCEIEIDAYFRGAKWMQKQFIKNTEQ